MTRRREHARDAITRRDFLNGALLGTGGLLLGAAAPAAGLRALQQEQDDWTGYGGVGDYARSNGNTLAVREGAHLLRDPGSGALAAQATDTGEVYDLVIVGGGLSGLSAAYTFLKETGGGKTCLILENHPIFGGESKQNELVINGVRLTAPQGSNGFGAPAEGSGTAADALWTDLKMPREFAYQALDPSLDPLRIPLDNYAPMEGVAEKQVDVGYFFDRRSGVARPQWVRNIWANDLADAPFSAEVKADLLRWRAEAPVADDAFRRTLDSMTYRDYLERVLKLRPEVTQLITPVVGLINGATPDAVSAFAAAQVGLPGVSRPRSGHGPLPQSFPGGNSTYARHFVKYLIPTAITGPASFEGVMQGRVYFEALDRADQPTRIRLAATVVRVEHTQAGAPAQVAIAYQQNGRTYRLHARTVVMASGGWVNQRVIADLPYEMRAAYGAFAYAPALVVNVGLTNWRFLYKLGAPSVRWFSEDFGFYANIRRPMLIPGEAPTPLHPDRPAVLTFYMGLYLAGRPAAEQGKYGRARLYATTYADYEALLRTHMARLFAGSGFVAKRDIGALILNRWGHARVVQTPGFYYGINGKAAPRQVIQAGFGRIAIGHSELNGHQTATGAIAQGERAARQALALL